MKTLVLRTRLGLLLVLVTTLGLMHPLLAAPVAAQGYGVETVVEDVDLPWSLNFAPDGRLFFTARDTGAIHTLHVDTGQVETFTPSMPILYGGEGGLLGMVLDPDFETNQRLYVCYSVAYGGQEVNRVSRWELNGNQLTGESIYIEMPHARIHNGCRLAFSPDNGYLFVTMGDAGNADRAQDIDSLSGKILRLTRDGGIPVDNPWPGRAVWSMGHRNPQGLAFEPATGLLWSTEHGPSTQDELNVIKKGRNYGWPLCLGEESTCPGVADYEPAVREFYADETIAMSDMLFYTGDAFPDWQGDLFFVTLKTGRLYRLEISGETVISEERLVDNEYGRLRDIVEGPDGLLYFSTDVRDGGAKILRIRPLARTFIPVIAVG